MFLNKTETSIVYHSHLLLLLVACACEPLEVGSVNKQCEDKKEGGVRNPLGGICLRGSFCFFFSKRWPACVTKNNTQL